MCTQEPYVYPQKSHICFQKSHICFQKSHICFQKSHICFQSCHARNMIHVTRMNKSHQSCHMYECDMSHIQMSHAKHVAGLDFWSGSRLHISHVTRAIWFMSHTWMSHVTYMNESCHTCGRSWFLVWLPSSSTFHGTLRFTRTHMNESRHTYEWVTSHIWMRHVAHMNESHHTYEWDTSHTYEWVTSHIWMSHVTRTNESRHTYEWVTSHTWMSHVTHANESRHTHALMSRDMCDYGVATISRLLKNIGLFCRISSLLQVSFAKETYNFKEPTSRSHPIVECVT